MMRNTLNLTDALIDAVRTDAAELENNPQRPEKFDPTDLGTERRREAWHNVCQALPLLNPLKEMIRRGGPTLVLVGARDAIAVQIIQDLYYTATSRYPVAVTVEHDQTGTWLRLVVRPGFKAGTAEYDAFDYWVTFFSTFAGHDFGYELRWFEEGAENTDA